MCKWTLVSNVIWCKCYLVQMCLGVKCTLVQMYLGANVAWCQKVGLVMGFRSRILPTGSQSADSNNISAFYQRWMKLFRPFFAKLQFHRHAIGKNAARQFLGSWVLICDILQGMGVVCVYVCVCVGYVCGGGGGGVPLLRHCVCVCVSLLFSPL